MAFSFDDILGVHQPALITHSRRAQLLASNLANADTPGYKARDIDFRQALSQYSAPMNRTDTMYRTHARHFELQDPGVDLQAKYRIPHQPSLDGNTVEQHTEMAAYTDNTMRYLAALRFLNGKFNGLRTAIKGQ